MKKLAIAVAAIAALTGSAFAADIPVRAPVYKAPPPVPHYSWTGCYIGGGGGYGLWNQENTGVDDDGFVFSNTVTFGGHGWFGTAQVGCDYQVGAKWVIGAFGDWDFSSIKGTIGNGTFNGEEKLSWSWAAGGRIGYLPWDQLLVFVSGGYTQAHFDQVNFSAPDGTPASFILDHTYHGWFLGTGYEYSLASFLRGLTWKTEYRFADYETDRNPVYFADTSLPTGANADSRKWVQTVRSELVLRFWSR